MVKKILFVLTILLFTSGYSYSQESCSCSSTEGGCSASQSCPPGKSATCVCTSAGCSSSCSKTTEEVLVDEGVSRMANVKAGNIDNVLSYASGLNIKFTPANKNYKFSGLDISKTPSWVLLDELSQNGEVSINGQKVDFWKGVRKTLLEGGEFKLCSGGATANKVLNIVSFISGKRHLITSGDANAKITGQIEGNNLSEVLESLQKISGTTIAENN
jgi:hypothetical protein